MIIKGSGMKKIYIANQSKQKLGGGFIFIDNFAKGIRGKARLVSNWRDADIVFIVSATMTSRQEIQEAKSNKRKIVLRVDNMPKDSRNRGTAFSRMRDYGKLSDWVIYQSEWAKNYVGEWLQFNHGVKLKRSTVIYNGVDTEYFFYKDNPKNRGETYLFTTYNTDENKRFPEAAYDFHLRHFKALKDKKSVPKLRLVGNFPKDTPRYNFDFFNGEKIDYSPPISDRMKMGNVYRSCRYLYFPAFADASPNTVSEAMACGCEVLLSSKVGGTREVIEQYSKKTITIQDMAERYLEIM